MATSGQEGMAANGEGNPPPHDSRGQLLSGVRRTSRANAGVRVVDGKMEVEKNKHRNTPYTRMTSAQKAKARQADARRREQQKDELEILLTESEDDSDGPLPLSIQVPPRLDTVDEEMDIGEKDWEKKGKNEKKIIGVEEIVDSSKLIGSPKLGVGSEKWEEYAAEMAQENGDLTIGDIRLLSAVPQTPKALLEPMSPGTKEVEDLKKYVKNGYIIYELMSMLGEIGRDDESDSFLEAINYFKSTLSNAGYTEWGYLPTQMLMLVISWSQNISISDFKPNNYSLKLYSVFLVELYKKNPDVQEELVKIQKKKGTYKIFFHKFDAKASQFLDYLSFLFLSGSPDDKKNIIKLMTLMLLPFIFTTKKQHGARGIGDNLFDKVKIKKNRDRDPDRANKITGYVSTLVNKIKYCLEVGDLSSISISQITTDLETELANAFNISQVMMTAIFDSTYYYLKMNKSIESRQDYRSPLLNYIYYVCILVLGCGLIGDPPDKQFITRVWNKRQSGGKLSKKRNSIKDLEQEVKKLNKKALSLFKKKELVKEKIKKIDTKLKELDKKRKELGKQYKKNKTKTLKNQIDKIIKSIEKEKINKVNKKKEIKKISDEYKAKNKELKNKDNALKKKLKKKGGKCGCLNKK